MQRVIIACVAVALVLVAAAAWERHLLKQETVPVPTPVSSGSYKDGDSDIARAWSNGGTGDRERDTPPAFEQGFPFQIR